MLPRKYSYAIGLAASLKEEFNGDGAVVFYLTTKETTMKLTYNRIGDRTRADKFGRAGASNVRSLNRFGRGSFGWFVRRSSGGLIHESTHVE